MRSRWQGAVAAARPHRLEWDLPGRSVEGEIEKLPDGEIELTYRVLPIGAAQLVFLYRVLTGKMPDFQSRRSARRGDGQRVGEEPERVLHRGALQLERPFRADGRDCRARLRA